MKRRIIWILTLCVMLALSACAARGETEASPAASAAAASTEMPAPRVTAEPDPYPPGERPSTDEPTGGMPSAAPAPTAAPTPIPTPAPTPVPTPAPLRAGKYTGSDGSVLTVNADGTCTYETELSGTVNGRRMSGRVTFHGTAVDGAFSFTRVTYFGLDLTELARAAGYSDASYWEAAAAIIYAGGQ